MLWVTRSVVFGPLCDLYCLRSSRPGLRFRGSGLPLCGRRPYRLGGPLGCGGGGESSDVPVTPVLRSAGFAWGFGACCAAVGRARLWAGGLGLGVDAFFPVLAEAFTSEAIEVPRDVIFL